MNACTTPSTPSLAHADPARTEIFPRELKLWQSRRFLLWAASLSPHGENSKCVIDVSRTTAETTPFMRLRARTRTRAQARPSPLSLPSGPTYALFLPAEQQQELCCPGDPLLHSLRFASEAFCCARMSLTVLFASAYIRSCLSGIIKIK